MMYQLRGMRTPTGTEPDYADRGELVARFTSFAQVCDYVEASETGYRGTARFRSDSVLAGYTGACIVDEEARDGVPVDPVLQSLAGV